VVAVAAEALRRRASSQSRSNDGARTLQPIVTATPSNAGLPGTAARRECARRARNDDGDAPNSLDADCFQNGRFLIGVKRPAVVGSGETARQCALEHALGVLHVAPVRPARRAARAARLQPILEARRANDALGVDALPAVGQPCAREMRAENFYRRPRPLRRRPGRRRPARSTGFGDGGCSGCARAAARDGARRRSRRVGHSAWNVRPRERGLREGSNTKPARAEYIFASCRRRARGWRAVLLLREARSGRPRVN